MPDIVFDITQNNIQFALEQVGRIDFSIVQPEIHFEIQGAVVSGGVSGSSDFLGLTDTPDDYTGHGAQVVIVEEGEAGLAFADADAHSHPYSPTGHTHAHIDLTGKNSETDVKHLTDAQVSALHPAVNLATNHGLSLVGATQQIGLGTISDCSPSVTSQVTGAAHVHKVTGVATDTHTHPIITYPASSLNVVAGSITGTIAGVAEHDDASELRINETATSPGFNVEFIFNGVASFTSLVGRAYYSGSPSHQVSCEVWNLLTSVWDRFNLMSDEDGYGWKAFPAYNPVHYINAGQVKIRFFHIGTGTYPGMGTVGHYLYIDYLVLQEGGGAGGGVTEHGALTGLEDDDHQQYLPLLGSRQMTGYLGVHNDSIGNGSRMGDMRFNPVTKIPEFWDSDTSQWQSADCPVYLDGSATLVAEGNNFLSIGASKSLIKWIFIKTTSQNWTMTLYSNATYTNNPITIASNRAGDYAIYLDLPYQDEQQGNKVYYNFTDNIASVSHDIKIYAMKLR